MLPTVRNNPTASPSPSPSHFYPMTARHGTGATLVGVHGMEIGRKGYSDNGPKSLYCSMPERSTQHNCSTVTNHCLWRTVRLAGRLTHTPGPVSKLQYSYCRGPSSVPGLREHMGRQSLPTVVIPLLQHGVEGAIDVPGLEIQPSGSDGEHVQAILLLDPMGQHVHAGHRAAAGPDIAVDDPLLLLGPVDFGELLLRPVVLDVVDRGGAAVEHARRGHDRGTRARREERLPRGDVPADELGVRGREGEADGVGPANQQGVQLRRVVDGRGRHDGDGAGQQADGLERLADVVEHEVGGPGEGALVDRHEMFDRVQDRLRARVEEVKRPEHVDGLVVVDQGAEVEGGHIVVRWAAATKSEINAGVRG
ncbi:hypothetical protein, variant [Phialophora macrospora]|uniref:Uncharacterized protein n=1 Tax=Phialophora macrospora TaxID=1851006 RepID=A0A0D2F590_9EURO|nr:hypothetical protein PV04_09909 [Phialophora macrospora]KIW63029.1 hypothetical protein, variant [Phialophora macrospora]